MKSTARYRREQPAAMKRPGGALLSCDEHASGASAPPGTSPYPWGDYYGKQPKWELETLIHYRALARRLGRR